MSRPLYANTWYTTPDVRQLRQEIQNLYAQLPTVVTDTVPPTSTDDETDGYQLGDRWYDTVGENEYVCISAEADAAVWKQTT